MIFSIIIFTPEEFRTFTWDYFIYALNKLKCSVLIGNLLEVIKHNISMKAQSEQSWATGAAFVLMWSPFYLIGTPIWYSGYIIQKFSVQIHQPIWLKRVQIQNWCWIWSSERIPYRQNASPFPMFNPQNLSPQAHQAATKITCANMWKYTSIFGASVVLPLIPGPSIKKISTLKPCMLNILMMRSTS